MIVWTTEAIYNHVGIQFGTKVRTPGLTGIVTKKCMDYVQVIWSGTEEVVTLSNYDSSSNNEWESVNALAFFDSTGNQLSPKATDKNPPEEVWLKVENLNGYKYYHVYSSEQELKENISLSTMGHGKYRLS